MSFELPLLLLKSIKHKKETFTAIFMMVKGGAGRTTIDQLERNLQLLKEFDEASDILRFFNQTMKKAGSRISKRFCFFSFQTSVLMIMISP